MNIANERIKLTADFMMKIGIMLILASMVMIAAGIVGSIYAVGLIIVGLLALGGAFSVLGRLHAE